MKANVAALLLLGCGPTYIDATGLSPSTLSNGLVAHYAFDEGEGTRLVDDSGNRRDGTVSGATFTSDGRFGGALHFEPGASATVSSFPYATSSWTFSGWLRVAEEDVAGDDFGTIVSTEALDRRGGWQWQTRGQSEGVYWTFAYALGSGQSYAHYESRLGRKS